MRVVFFPKTAIPVSVCSHRYGNDMTFSEQTDSRFLSSTYTVEKYGFKNNIRLGCFANNQLSSQQNGGISAQNETGVVRMDTYYSVDLWRNPNTGVIETIPDHYATAYTSLGAEYFNVNVGDPKPVQTPNHGQQLFDLTDGLLGYDFINGVIGDSNLEEWEGVIDNQQDWHLTQFGRLSSSFSYRNGNYNTLPLMPPKLLAVRNSNASRITSQQAETYYGSGLGHSNKDISSLREYFISYDSTTRWWDAWNTYGQTEQVSIDYLITCLDRGLSDQGWVRDFIHWHSARTKGNIDSIDRMLQSVSNWSQGKRVHFCSNGEAIEYMFFRESISNISAYEKNGKVQVVFWGNNMFPELNTDMLNTPISVEINLTGTILEGKNIVPSFSKAISLGGDRYIIEIPYHGEFGAVEISEGLGGEFDISVPAASSLEVDGTVLVTTNIPTKAVLFSGNNDSDILRSNDFSTEHVFEVSGISSYEIGVISEFGMSRLV